MQSWGVRTASPVGVTMATQQQVDKRHTVVNISKIRANLCFASQNVFCLDINDE